MGFHCAAKRAKNSFAKAAHKKYRLIYYLTRPVFNISNWKLGWSQEFLFSFTKNKDYLSIKKTLLCSLEQFFLTVGLKIKQNTNSQLLSDFPIFLIFSLWSLFPVYLTSSLILSLKRLAVVLPKVNKYITGIDNKKFWRCCPGPSNKLASKIPNWHHPSHLDYVIPDWLDVWIVPFLCFSQILDFIRI